MSQSGNWFSRLFSNSSTRGLSGDADRVDLGEGALGFFTSCLKLHEADDDIHTHPQKLWEARGKRKGGLYGHLIAQRGDGMANFTDLLVILNEHDYDLAVDSADTDWLRNTTNLIELQADEFCEKTQFSRVFPDRPFQIVILRDYGPELEGQGLGLQPRQFVTGLIPSLYKGPVSSSWPVIAIHANLPGIWEGYQQIGILYDDQLLFTIGSHWLDNFHHPALREPAVYRIQRSPEGTLTHIVNPDLAERFTIESVQTQGGPAVLVLSDSGEPIAYLVLALADSVTDAASAQATPVQTEPEPTPPEPEAPAIPAIQLPQAPEPVQNFSSETMPFYALPGPVPPEKLEEPVVPVRVASQAALAAAALVETIPTTAPEPERPAPAAQPPEPPRRPHLPRPAPPPPPAPCPPPELLVDTPPAEPVLSPPTPVVEPPQIPAAPSAMPPEPPALVVEPPALVVEPPALVVEPPALVVEPPAPIVEAPAPIVEAPAPIVEAPAPIVPPPLPQAPAALPPPREPTPTMTRLAPPAGRPAPPIAALAPDMSISLGGNTGFSRTIVPDIIDERIFTLKERGVLLQRVHFANFMEGYDVYVSPTGQLGTGIVDPAATFQVRDNRVFFHCQSPDVRLADKQIPLGTRLVLPAEVEIRIGNQVLEYRDLSRIVEDGWPYLAEIRRASSSTYMVFGGKYRIGRDRRCKLRLPDEPHNDNIYWRSELRDTDTIRSRTGDIPKSRFYSDSIMVASEHAEVDLTREPLIRCVARHCYTYIRRGMDIIALYPSEREGAFNNLDLLPGDEILLGNSLFEVSYPPASGPRMPRNIPAESLPKPYEPKPARPVVLPPTAPAQPAPAPAPKLAPPTSFSPVEPPAAVGLGEKGPPPPVLPLVSPAFDSVMNLEAPTPRGLSTTDAPPDAAAFRAPPPIVTPPTAPDPHAVEPIPSVYMPDCQLELSRPARFVQLGWSVVGEIVLGNHRDADAVVPESRTSRDQRFVRRDYFRLRVRGSRGQIIALHPTEVTLNVRGQSVAQCEDLDGAEFSILRRDAEGEVDFAIPLRMLADASLPDPRARLVRIGLDQHLVAALFTQGLPHRVSRRVHFGNIDAEATFDGTRVLISDYLRSYKLPGGGFRPFFFRASGSSFRTAPENGSTFALTSGDLLISGTGVFTFLIP